MNATFLNALQSKATQAQAARTVKPADVRIPKGAAKALQVTIERVVNRHRLDVFFSHVPSRTVLDSLKEHGFKWNKDRLCWYHADTKMNRAYLTLCFGETFIGDQYETDVTGSTETQDSAPTLPTPRLESPIPVIDSTGDANQERIPFSPEYERYKQQVNELLAHTKIDAADLMLQAIDCLHKQLLGSN